MIYPCVNFTEKRGKKGMKKAMKKVIALVMAMTMLLAAAPICTYAQEDGPADIVQVLPPPLHTVPMTMQPSIKEQKLGIIRTLLKYRKVTATSSNTKIAEVKAVKIDNQTTDIMVIPKKTGKVVITTKVANNTYTNIVMISKYANPVSSLKLGSTTIAGRKFSKTDTINLSYSKFAKKNNKFNITLKKGWILGTAQAVGKNIEDIQYLYNGQTFKLNSGKGNFKLVLTLVKQKTGKSVTMVVNFK